MLPEERAEIIQRLRHIEGHLGAVIVLLEVGKPHEQVLYQLGAVRSALRAAGAKLLDSQIKSCEEYIRNNSCPDDRAAMLIRLINLYDFVIQYSDQIEKISHE